MSAFPNPLNVNFGYGRIIVCEYVDCDGRGVALLDAGKENPIGSDCGLPPEMSHTPQENEIYLRFANIESAQVLHDTLGEVIKKGRAEGWKNPEPDHAPRGM